MAFDVDIFGNCDGLFYCLASWSNTVTEGLFWTIILIAWAIVIFMGTFNLGAKRAFGYASFSMALLSLILIQLGLISTLVLTISLIAGLIGVAAMLVGRER